MAPVPASTASRPFRAIRDEDLGPADRLRPDAPEALVVEDDVHAADISSTMLNVLGYRTRVAKTGHEALFALAERPPALVLLDICLPEMDGVTLLKVARRVAETRETPVVACSAVYPPKGSVAQVMRELGVQEYLAKPFNMAALREAVGRAHPEGPAPNAPEPKRPSAVPSPIFAPDEVVARAVSDRGELLCALLELGPTGARLRWHGPAPSPGSTVRLEVEHRFAVNDAMTEVKVRILGSVQDVVALGKNFEVRMSVTASAPPGALPSLIRAMR